MYDMYVERLLLHAYDGGVQFWMQDINLIFHSVPKCLEGLKMTTHFRWDIYSQNNYSRAHQTYITYILVATSQLWALC